MRRLIYSTAIAAAFGFVSGAYAWEAINAAQKDKPASYSDAQRRALTSVIKSEVKRAKAQQRSNANGTLYNRD